MSNPVIAPADLSAFLGAEVGYDRAFKLIGWAQSLCESIVSPLPAGAEAVVLDVTARAYTNPTNAAQEAVGPYSTSFGTVGGGLWLTRQNKDTLRRLAGGGGAFTVDTVPATAGQNLPGWDVDGYVDGYFDTPVGGDGW